MHGQSRILVVDDEHDICANLHDILTDFGYEVSTATDGVVAMQLAADQHFDVALLDLRMPGMDGLQVFRELKAMTPKIVALMVTAFASAETEAEAEDAGVWRVMTKPLDPSQLLPALDEALMVVAG